MLLLLLHLASCEPIVNQYGAHVHALSTHHRHAASHLLGQAHALNLDKVAHILASTGVSELTLHHLLLLRHLLLHLELHIVEHAIKVDRVEFHWHFDCRVLLEVYKRCLPLLRIDHTSGTLDALALLNCDLFAIEDHKLDEALDHDHAIVRLASDRVVDQ